MPLEENQIRSRSVHLERGLEWAKTGSKKRNGNKELTLLGRGFSQKVKGKNALGQENNKNSNKNE